MFRRILWSGLLAACACTADDDEAPTDDTIDSSPPFETGVPRTGCDDPALAAALAEVASWTQGGTCGWAYMGLASDDRTTAITVSIEVPEAALVVGETFTMDLSQPVANGGVSVVQGAHLLEGACDDVEPDNPPEFTRTWQAARGTATLRVTRVPEGWDPAVSEQRFDAEVEVTDLVVVHDDLACAVPDWTKSGSFGWTPG